MNKDTKKCLIDLLLDLESKEYQNIKREANAVNIFKVLKLTRAEIRHSNLLAWLLDPNGNHQFGSTFNKYFFNEIYNDTNADIDSIDFNWGKLFLESVDNFIVYRERFNIDVLLVADKQKQLVCLENKIDSFTHSEQLLKYETILNQQFPKYEKLFLYLTPNDEDIAQYPNWHKISYQPVSNALQKVLDTTSLNYATKILLEDYQTIVKGEIMEEQNEIEKLCLEIYKKHQAALDLIFEYRPDEDLAISEAIIDFLQSRNDIVYDGFNSGKTLLRFTTPTMLELFPNAAPNPNSPWEKGYAFMYEMYIGNGKIAAVFAHPVYDTPQQQTAFEQKIQSVFDYTQKHNQTLGINKKHKMLNDNWKWYTAFGKVLLDRKNFNGTTEELIDNFKKQLTTFIEKELPEFENKIKTTLAPLLNGVPHQC